MNNELARTVGWLAHRLLEVPPLVLLSFSLAYLVLSIWAHWTIARRAGYSGCLSLLLLVPCINLIAIVLFAFCRWPIQGNKKA